MKVTKLCNTRDIVTVNGLYPGPVVYAQEDDRVIVKVINEAQTNVTIHWYLCFLFSYVTNFVTISCWYHIMKTDI
jgi:Multicopper oxidase